VRSVRIGVFGFLAECDQLLLESQEPIADGVRQIDVVHGGIQQAFPLGEKRHLNKFGGSIIFSTVEVAGRPVSSPPVKGEKECE
jgi:hypothetical protein